VSASVFPTFAGIRPGHGRAAEFFTDVFSSFSGREQRTIWWSRPRWRYQLSLDFARCRAVDAIAEAETLWGFYQAHAGSGDSFLFLPEGEEVSGCGFGVGDGTTTAFQLQRSLGGALPTTYESLAVPTVRRRNYACNLASVTNSQGGTGVLPVLTNNAGIGPDGTPTAMRAVLNLGGGSSGSDWSDVVLGLNLLPTADGSSYTASVWLRTLAGTAQVAVRARQTYRVVTVTTTWQRFSVTAPHGSSDRTALSVILVGTLGTSDTAELLVWGPQCELGSVATSTMNANTDGTLSSTPSYWPALGGGFEPVTDPAPGWYPTLDGDGLGLRTLYPFSRTNLVTYSNTLSDASWVKPRVTATGGQAGAPDGTATAWLVQEDNTASATHALTHSMTWPAGTRCWSVYAKAKERTRIKLARSSDSAGVIFDLTTGSIVSSDAGFTGAIAPAGGGWYRCWIVKSLSAADSDTICPHLVSGVLISYSGDGTSGLYLWGFQAEMGSSPGDYIPTTTAAASRTDYTISATGLVTCAVAPRTNAQLAWTGSAYRRCRFEQDSLSLERILAGLWSGKGIALLSVK